MTRGTPGSLKVDITRKIFAAPRDAARLVLGEVAFHLAPGEFAALVGPSGCGKTTLLNIIADLDDDVIGTVRLGDLPASTARLGYVFQQPRLLPWRTVFENIALVLPKPTPRAWIEHLLDEMGIGAARDVYPSRLSLGMARRVAIARALAIEPELLLMDEPFTSLDETTADRLRALLVTLLRKRPTTVLLVTHDAREAIALADRILFLSASPGRLLGDVPVPLPRERRTDPAAIEAVRMEIFSHHRRWFEAGETGKAVEVEEGRYRVAGGTATGRQST
jgi:ABC-type nitrate/sulfonate/bicarbonate transport system ATPase subunit